MAIPLQRDGVSDARRIQQTLTHIAQHKPALSWVDDLKVQNITDDLITCAPAPGRREIIHFADPGTLERLAGLLSEALGRRVRLKLELPLVTPDDTPATGGETGSVRERARKLPLVKKVFEAFPDATMIDAHEEENKD